MASDRILVAVVDGRLRMCRVGSRTTDVPWTGQARARVEDGRIVLDGPDVGGGRQVIGAGEVAPIGGALASCHDVSSQQGEPLVVRFGTSMVASSPAMIRVFHVAACVARRDSPILLLGESGTGKDLLARELHRLGRGADRPYVAVNMAALPPDLAEAELFGWMRGSFTGAGDSREGAFEAAATGTLFLDEIGEAAPFLQAKLLRAVEGRQTCRIGSVRPVPFRGRIVAATNRDPASAVHAGHLRLDLLERLACLVIRVPPLRERPEDVPVIARFLGAGGGDCSAPDAGAEEVLAGYAWPGNVRELANVLRRATALAGRSRLDARGIRDALDACRLDLAPVSGVRDRLDPVPYGARTQQIAASGMPRSTFYDRARRGALRGIGEGPRAQSAR